MKKNIPPILSIGFRPFFFLATLIAIINPTLWISIYTEKSSLYFYNVDSLFWHAHEMLFGFVGALIAGFILTASANWTASKPYKGYPLLFLILAWLTERISYFIPCNQITQLILLNLFFPSLLIMLYLKLKNFPKQKYVFLPILLGISLGSFMHTWGYLFSNDFAETSGKNLAIGFIRFIVLLIAGRVLPFFTRMRIQGVHIELPKFINPLALAPLLLLIIPWPESTPKILLATIYLWAIIAGLIRQFMWKPFKSIKIPILFILHIGIFLIYLSLIQELIGLYNEDMHYTQAALHTLMAGGLSIVGIGIMNRVSLGHTGRFIEADKWMITAYIFIIIGAILRFAVPVIFPDYFFSTIHYASGFWTSGFIIFLFKFIKIWFTPRPDGKEH